MKLMCVLTDGFEDIETIGTIAILRRAGIEVEIFGLKNTTVTSRFKTILKDLRLLSDLENRRLAGYNGLLITGGPQFNELQSNKEFISIIQNFANQQRYICAICAAPTILGRMGLLKNKQYTCFPTMNNEFKGYFLQRDCVIDGKLITAKSSASVYEFAFGIIKTLLGDKKLEQLKKEIYWNK